MCSSDLVGVRGPVGGGEVDRGERFGGRAGPGAFEVGQHVEPGGDDLGEHRWGVAAAVEDHRAGPVGADDRAQVSDQIVTGTTKACDQLLAIARPRVVFKGLDISRGGQRATHDLECRMFFGLVICWFLRLRNGFGTIPVRLHSGSGIQIS